MTLAAEPLGPSCSVDPGGVSATVGSAPPRRSRGALAAVPSRPRRFGDGTAALWRRYRGALATVPPRLATLWRRCAALLATPGEAHRRPSRTAAPTAADRRATVAAATLERRRASPNTGKTSAVARRADVFGANLHGTGFTFRAADAKGAGLGPLRALPKAKPSDEPVGLLQQSSGASTMAVTRTTRHRQARRWWGPSSFKRPRLRGRRGAPLQVPRRALRQRCGSTTRTTRIPTRYMARVRAGQAPR